MLDLILREGWLIDPERLTMLPGSLGVKDGKIAGIYPMGAALPEAAEVVDLHGDAVSPGFIDVHAHLDGHVECGRRSLLQGITTSFGGNCGLSPVDMGAFYASQKDGFCVHQAEFVGHSFSLREAVGLTDTRQSARPDQIAQMKALARRAMDDGAWGVSFGLDYCPGCSFREVEALGRLTAEYGGRHNGCIINTAQQLTDTPRRISIAVNKANYTHDMIAKTGVFSLSVLTTAAPFALFEQFGFHSGRDTDKFDGNRCEIRTGENGLVYLNEYANAVISGKVVEARDCGTHTLFIADVTEARVLSDAPSLTYAYYFDHIKPRPRPREAERSGWVCRICGYVYEGDTLPEDYICPLCKHGADDFERLK